MNGDIGNGIGKELTGPGEEEILATWARVISDLKASKVCFYPGPGRGQNPDFPDFTGALSLIEDCNALVYAEPARSKMEVWSSVNDHRVNLAVPIPGDGLILGLDMTNTGDLPEVDRRGLFRVTKLPWLPPEEQPDDSRFWGEYSELTIEHGRNQKQVRLLHIGIGGLAAGLYFFQPHQIEVAKFIGTPF